jgi:hypothetical protein
MLLTSPHLTGSLDWLLISIRFLLRTQVTLICPHSAQVPFRLPKQGTRHTGYFDNLSQCSDVASEKWNLQILVNLLLINVSNCVSCNVKTIGLYYIQLPTIGVHSRPPDRAHIVCHRMNEMLIKQNTIYDGQATYSVMDSSWHLWAAFFMN